MEKAKTDIFCGGKAIIKTIAVYPSTSMDIICPTCYFAEELNFLEPPQEDFQITCSRCNEIIAVKLNRREHYRKHLSIPVYYSSSEFDNILDSGVKSGWIVDISKSGIGIEISSFKYSEECEKAGNILTIAFSLPPQNKQIKVRGQIVRICADKKLKVNVGIKFINLDEYQKQIISFFLRP